MAARSRVHQRQQRAEIERLVRRVQQESTLAPKDCIAFVVASDELPLFLTDGEEPPPDIFVGKRGGALAARVSWAPNDDAPFKDVWTITAVVSGLPALCVNGPYDGEWYPIPPQHFPWFVAATAGGIRKSLEDGDVMTFKRATDPRLYDTMGDGEPPPEDEHGRI